MCIHKRCLLFYACRLHACYMHAYNAYLQVTRNPGAVNTAQRCMPLGLLLF